MDGKSLTPQEIKLQELKNIFPEVFAEDKVDWEKLKATLGEDINFSNERYVLNWAGKSEAFKVLQAPTTKTLIPAKDESVNFNDTENIFIEGENLEVLKVLQKSYFGKVKMIYIDPPYNTGNDHFIYPDKFSETKEDYEKRVGDKDEDGYMTKDGMFKKNSKENGQYHSNWMNMMYPRLFLAKNLLKQDGVIFISIDDNEVHNLRMMMNEVFGEENFVSNTIWRSKDNSNNDAKGFSTDHNHTLVYSKTQEWQPTLIKDKSKQKHFKNPDNDKNGPYFDGNPLNSPNYRENLIYNLTSPNGNIIEPPKNGWRWSKEVMDEKIKSKEIYFTPDETNIRRRTYLKDMKGLPPSSLMIDLNKTGHNRQAKYELLSLLPEDLFDTPKPIKLIKYLIQLSSINNDDIILDFFSGSGTTAHAVMDLNKEDGGNRKSISVQLPELCDEKSEAFKAGYNTIADIAKERIRRAGNKINDEIKTNLEAKKNEIPFGDEKAKIKLDLGFKVLKLADSNFKQWQQIKNKDAKALEDQMKLFIDPVAENATIENMVYELMLKSGKNLNSKIEHAKGFCAINENELILLLEKADQKIINNIIAEKPKKVVALDKLFKGNDQLKTNTVLQMKDAGIEFKTI
ncbi:site-specific DNA-methyltransferase [Leeuwenhoekiella marinoflava]|uniref:site-specific DNA-methyltransferase (adenine-specific) n=2 Tax=Leeuwenhoekiella marinoflava TaxID=988 RepID=A0A4V1KSE3_9FLAO|nr:site-specific DNA-methyltransferase [Leeuwenhoekiella marinoflava]RXG30689.1 adenine-specific DNA-methyltransferase [Leeuwenhoekiella marinoflava]SHF19573.1 adenine-specific DNA-methyltransferase [Leeuwenhoekiella marinoflava DSM 3653]